MRKPKYLYHGSKRKISLLEPRKAKGLGKKKENKLTAVYATDHKKTAMIMGMISGGGVKLSSLPFSKGKAKGIVYDGWPKNKFFYLHYLPSDNFIKLDSWQWTSYNPVKPIKIEKLLIKKYLHLIRKASEKEKKEFFRKHGKELPKKYQLK